MSWDINPNTAAVTMHRGDTGAYTVTLKRSDNEPFKEGDVAIYEVLFGKTVMLHREFDLQPAEPDSFNRGNGKFLIAFRNSDTDTWATGTYRTEIRVALKALRDLVSYIAVTPIAPYDNPITATLDEETLLDYVTETSGTIDLEYTTEWSEDPTLYGVTVTGTPADGDIITVSWNKNGTRRVKDGTTVRTPRKLKSTLQILDVDIEI